MHEGSDVPVEETVTGAEGSASAASVAVAAVTADDDALAVEVTSTVLCSQQLGVEEAVVEEATLLSPVLALSIPAWAKPA